MGKARLHRPRGYALLWALLLVVLLASTTTQLVTSSAVEAVRASRQANTLAHELGVDSLLAVLRLRIRQDDRISRDLDRWGFATVELNLDACRVSCRVADDGHRLEGDIFPNTPSGHRRLLAWAMADGPIRRFGIEGSANLGAGLARFLSDNGQDVVEVPGRLTVRERTRLRRGGKSDPMDALAIARVTARETTLPPVRRPGLAEDLKVLSDFRDELVVQRNAEGNRLHADLAIVSPGYARSCRSLVSARALTRASGLLRGQGSMRARLARRRIKRLRKLDAEIAVLTSDI